MRLEIDSIAVDPAGSGHSAKSADIAFEDLSLEVPGFICDEDRRGVARPDSFVLLLSSERLEYQTVGFAESDLLTRSVELPDGLIASEAVVKHCESTG